MNKFITKSQVSNKILKSATLASSLPVNVLIIGEVGVGKKLLTSYILPNAIAFKGLALESLIKENKINLNEYDSLIVYDIQDVLNIEEFIGNLKKIKLVATSLDKIDKISKEFAIKIDIPPLIQRPEDLEELKNIYLNEASKIYDIDFKLKEIEFDLSKNSFSLKQSIFKSILLQSLNEKDIKDILVDHLSVKLLQDSTYKDLMKIFEIPLLIAAKKAFKSQLKMSKQLNINRITLRKKLFLYFGTE